MNKEDLTLFVRNLDEKVTEELLYELFLQAGPLLSVRIPSSNGVKRSYAFVEFKHEVSVPYAIYLLDGTRMYEKVIKLSSRSTCLNLFYPPLPNFRTSHRPASGDDSSLRAMGGSFKKRFNDKSMQPSGPPRKAQRSREESPPTDDSSSLRSMSGSLGKRFIDKSMQPSGPSKKFHKKLDESPPPNSWSANYYPSQCEETPKGYERSLIPRSRNKNHNDRGISNHLSRHHDKPPYHNEKYHNDRKRFDSHSSQRSRHHRPFTR